MMRQRTIQEIRRRAGEPIALRGGDTITLTAPAKGGMLVRCDIKHKPVRDGRGRFTNRTGFVIGAPEIRWTVTPLEEQ